MTIQPDEKPKFHEDQPEIYHFVHWVCETYQNIDGLVDRVQDDDIKKYFDKGTKAILLDLQSARGIMQRTVNHVREAVVISEAEKAVGRNDDVECQLSKSEAKKR